MVNNCIKIEQLSKRYPGESKDSLCGINLTIQEGEKFGILGPNGAGKTTLISILCGIMEQSSGNVYYWDREAKSDFAAVKQKMGFVPQEYAFYDVLTPMQNLEYFGAMYKLSATVIAARAKEILKILGLADVKHKRITTFSGGMKRRMNLAIGIIHKPSILFLDEPTVGVDVQSKVAILRILNELNQNGTTIIYTSHHSDEAQEFCTKLALLDKGKLILKGKTDALIASHNVNDLKELLLKFTGASYRD